MNLNKILKKALPHLAALVIFAAISALFFAPQYQGKSLSQGDMVRAAGMGQDIKEHIQEHGEHPQWAGNMFGGMPAYLIDMNYEGRYVKSVADGFYFLGQPAAFLFVAMSCFYLMLLLFGVNPWLGVIGGIAYGLSSYFPIIINAGHITKMMALAWIPGLVGGIYYAYRKNLWWGAAIAGIFAAIQISTSHYQITYYFLFVIAALVINEFIRAYKGGALKRFGRATAVLAAAAILAVGANFVQLYYVAGHSSQTIRGASELKSENQGSGLDKDYATAWSYGKAESFNMMLPNFVGGSSSGGFSENGAVASELKKLGVDGKMAQYMPSYWGTQPFTEGPVYIGVVVVFLALFGAMMLKGAQRWWIVGVSALALLLSWGHNFSGFDYFPLYNKFRVPSMILVILEFTLPLLAVLGLQKLFFSEGSKAEIGKKLNIAVGVVGGFLLLAYLVLPSSMSFSGDGDMSRVAGMFGFRLDQIPADAKPAIESLVSAMQSERAELLQNDALRGIGFVMVCAFFLQFYNLGRMKRCLAIGGLTLFAAIDLWSVDRRYVSEEDFHAQAPSEIHPTPANTEILKDTEAGFRVANFTADPFTDAHTSHFHRSVGGYHAAKLRRYQDLIEHYLSSGDMAIYNMLNTKYFITGEGAQLNPDALGAAWIVDTVVMVDGAQAEIDALGKSSFDPSRVAVVEEKFSALLDGFTPTPKDSTASVSLEDYKVNALTYKYSASEPSLVVFSEIYFADGWKMYIDGVESDYLRADYVLRAAVIPSGEHTIEWKFEAPNFAMAVGITRTCSLILLLSPLVLLALGFKTRRGNEEE